MASATAIRFSTPLHEVPAIGPRVARGLEALGLTTAGRLVTHLPMRHELEHAEAPIAELEPGGIISARGTITATRLVRRGRTRFEAVLVDGTGRLDLVWWNQAYMQRKVQPGMRVRVQGAARRFGPGIQVANPRLEVLPEDGEPGARDERLRPVYPAGEGLTSRQIERAVGAVLEPVLALLEDHLPEDFRRERALPALREAYRMVHTPASAAEAAAGRRRLAYDELLLLQLGVALRRRLRQEASAPALRWSTAVDAHIRARIPFALTPAQDEVVREVAADLQKTVPANRLIQGDVGSGKTVVALYAMLQAVAARAQGALLAPTELLAEQHFATIAGMLSGTDVRVALLTGSVPASERGPLLERIGRGDVDIVIGTHAILGEDVRFHALGVAVIDEQHRFGVHQRAGLREKGSAPAETGRTPHVLVMTATPIPRTLALTLFGDLDVSTIRALPPGRKPIATRVVPAERRDEVYRYVRSRLEKRERAYVVVPAIEPGAPDLFDSGTGGRAGLASVREVAGALEQGALAGFRIGSMHARLKRETRDRLMARFRAGELDVLVATTVIEVGVDVPEATVMVIEEADRFGLAQLHQLRGRVGRGPKRSVCVLIPGPAGATADGEARLRAMREVRDGFELAERDLELRGPGEVFGSRQAGAAPLKAADLVRDMELLLMARRDALAWIERSPQLDGPDEALLRRRLLRAHGERLGLGDVG